MCSSINHVIPYYLLASYYEDLKLTLSVGTPLDD